MGKQMRSINFLWEQSKGIDKASSYLAFKAGFDV